MAMTNSYPTANTLGNLYGQSGTFSTGQVLGAGVSTVVLGQGSATSFPFVPGQSGIKTIYIFTDAAGVNHCVTIDANHAYLIDAINNQYRLYAGRGEASMASGDFSLDELGVAEEIIEEMAGQ